MSLREQWAAFLSVIKMLPILLALLSLAVLITIGLVEVVIPIIVSLVRS